MLIVIYNLPTFEPSLAFSVGFNASRLAESVKAVGDRRESSQRRASGQNAGALRCAGDLPEARFVFPVGGTLHAI